MAEKEEAKGKDSRINQFELSKREESNVGKFAREDNVVEQQDVVKQEMIHAISGFGKWQMRKCMFILLIIWLPGSFHLLNMVFYRAKTDHWCAAPNEFSEWEIDEWRNLSSPRLPSGESDSCNIYHIDYRSLHKRNDGNFNKIKDDAEYQNAVSNKTVVSCDKYLGWDYDRSFWKRTIIQEWDIVCSRAYMEKWTQQVTFFGLLCGVIISGFFSDRFGRLPTMLVLIVLNSVGGTAAALSTSYYMFLVCVWLSGFAALGFGTVMYCWMMELLSGKEKTIFGCAPHFNFAFWGLIVAFVAYFIPDWQKMQLIFSVSLLFLIGIYWVLPESPRWLLTHGYTEQAEKIFRQISECNGKPLPADFKLHPPIHRDHKGRTKEGRKPGHGLRGFWDLFKTPNMRKKTFIIYYFWFAAAVVYYGLTLNSNSFGASLFVYYSFGKAIEFPFVFISIILLLKAGRRLSLIVLAFLCGMGLISTIFIPTGYYPYEWPTVLLNVCGRGLSVGVFSISYVYTSELFPTVNRNVGMGSSSVWARIGPMIAPYIADLQVIEPRLPIVIFGVLAMISSILVCFLPETAHHKLPDTMEEGENMGKGDSLFSAACFKKQKN